MPGKTTRRALIARAIAMQAQGATQAEIAKEMGVHRKTVSDWLRTPIAAEMIEQAMADARAVLTDGAVAAAETLIRLLANDDAVALGAAKTILDRTGVVPVTKVEATSAPPEAAPVSAAEASAKLRGIRGGRSK